MVIIIYSKNEVKNMIEIKKEEEIKNNICINECDSCIDKDKLAGEKENEKENVESENHPNDINGLVNINTASKEVLMTLSGIGESKAIAIIDYRKETPFKKIEDIMNVNGIGEKLYNEIKNNITV